MADREDEGAAPQDEEPARPPLDEDAAWAALVAGYDDDPEPGTGLWPEAEDITPKPAEPGQSPDTAELTDGEDRGPVNTVLRPADRSIVIHPVIHGPRDHQPPDDDEDEHFVPPEPPPLPEADVTTKFAWIAVLGGPLLLLCFVLFELEITWWALLVGVGGFLGGFTTLVARMRPDDDEEDRSGGGAVV